jgi:uncharacterized protein (TIGR00730 family)
MFAHLRYGFSLFYKLLRVSIQIVRGYYRLNAVPQPLVSIFGAARARLDERYAETAKELAGLFSKEGISVITDGGQGIMEAANCGVNVRQGTKGFSIGIGVRSLANERNMCVDQFFMLDYFFARKWLLTHYSTAFIVFPGGYGTLDELMEVLTLIETKTMEPVPIVLMGKDYWTPFVNWLKRDVLGHKYIDPSNLELFVLTDDPQEAFEIAKNICLRERGKKKKKKEKL